MKTTAQRRDERCHARQRQSPPGRYSSHDWLKLKRIEVDERIEIEDARSLAVLDKMVKQRRDSITQYEAAGRQELADVEIAEIKRDSGLFARPL